MKSRKSKAKKHSSQAAPSAVDTIVHPKEHQSVRSNNGVEILIVEDSPTQAEYLKNLLERRGYHVFVASNGKEGLASVRAHKPTIVISDIVMPEMDGFEMCHQIKSSPSLKDVPVILLTSLSDPSDIIRGLLCAADNFIVKPPDEKYLFSRIEYILVNRRLREQRQTQIGVEIYFGGQRHSINSDRLQILDLLFSTYETAVAKNTELAKAHEDLKKLNQELEKRVEERTAELVKEIEERKKIEQELRKLSRAVQQSPASVIITDTKGNIEYVNPKFEELTGYKLEEIRGKNPRILKSGETPMELYKELWNTILAGGEWQGEFHNKKKNGELHWESARISPIVSEHGITTHFLAVKEDITESKKAREALQQSEERYRSLVDEARDAIFSLSTSAIIKSLNPAFETITGWKREEWLGKSFTELLHTEDRRRAFEIFTGLLQGKKFAAQEYRVITKHGTYLTGEFATTPLIMEGKLMGILGIGRDITGRKSLEEQLRQAQKLESIGTLAGGIAHDFNNILGIIVAYGSLIQRGKISSAELTEYSSIMMKAAERGAGLVKQILTFARKSDVSVESVQVNYVIKELLSMLHQTFPKTIGFSIDLDKSLPLISIDSGQLNQALMNLCVNARDAILQANESGKMHSTISIKTATLLGESLRPRFSSALSDEYVCISVSDTGIGMDEKTRHRIFEPFFTTKEQGKGTGLGLAVVYGIVESHQGFIDLKTDVGKGTTFTIYFPVLKDGSAQAAAARKEIKEVSGGSETILIVEDEDALRMLLKNLLEAKGYTVMTAVDGLEAVQVFEKNRDKVAIVVSDHGLPGMNGADAARKMLEMRKDLKCIIASGYMEPNQKSDIFKSGVKEFIQKPYNPIDVLRKVREVLDLN